MSRRGSASFVPKALPYRINFSQQDTGKLVSASKKVATWRFGYPDVNFEQTLTLKHSVTGGKKEIIENGKEILKVGSQSVVKDFAHTWESEGRILRVAISIKAEYTFSVDGVVFEDFPGEYESKHMAQDMVAAKSKKEEHDKPRRHSSTKKTESPHTPKRHSATFDPFSSGANSSASNSFFDQNNQNDGFGSGSHDPFASTSSSSKTSTDPFSSGFETVKTSPPAPVVTSIEQPRERAPGLARQFTSPPEQYDTPTNSSFKSDDLFGDNTPVKQQQQEQQAIKQQSSSSANHQAASIDFFADNTSPQTQQKAPQQQEKHEQPAASFDFFSDDTESPVKQSSSVFDFTGMTYEMPTPQPMQQQQHVSIPDVLVPEQQQQQQEPSPPQQQQNQKSGINQSHFGLVNLDLSANSTAKSNHTQSIYGHTTSNSNVYSHHPPPSTNTSNNMSSDFGGFSMSGSTNNTGNNGYNNRMASGNIGMMTPQGGFMMSQPQNNNPSQPKKSSLDSLDWKM